MDFASDGSRSKIFDLGRAIFLMHGSGQPPMDLENFP